MGTIYKNGIRYGGGSGESITVDSTLSSTSENPVQNKVIKAALDDKADTSDIPTKTSDLTNDSNFLTDSDLPSIPTKTSDLTNDSGFLTSHQDITGKQDVIQYSIMPTASADNVGDIVQFIGTTTATYTNGYFYKCVSDGESTPTYSWENKSVQEGSSSGGVSDFDELTNLPDVATSLDMSEIIDPLPSVGNKMPILFDERGTEQKVGWYVLSNGTKKPVYEKTIEFTPTQSAEKKYYHNIENVDKIFFDFQHSYLYTSSGDYWYAKTGNDNNYNTHWWSVIWVEYDSFSVGVGNGIFSSNPSGYITFQYTKTTDTPI